jgi:hypothetical protein
VGQGRAVLGSDELFTVIQFYREAKGYSAAGALPVAHVGTSRRALMGRRCMCRGHKGCMCTASTSCIPPQRVQQGRLHHIYGKLFDKVGQKGVCRAKRRPGLPAAQRREELEGRPGTACKAPATLTHTAAAAAAAATTILLHTALTSSMHGCAHQQKWATGPRRRAAVCSWPTRHAPFVRRRTSVDTWHCARGGRRLKRLECGQTVRPPAQAALASARLPQQPTVLQSRPPYS